MENSVLRRVVLTKEKDKSKFIILFLIGLLFLTGCVSLSEDVTPPPGYQDEPTEEVTMEFKLVYPNQIPDPDTGKMIYEDNCLPCHGQLGLGGEPAASNLPFEPPAIGDPGIRSLNTPAEWYELIYKGNIDRMMPEFSNLTAPHIWDVVAYVFQLEITEEEVQIGRTIFEANCAQCHGVDGTGETGNTSAADLTDQTHMAQLSHNGIIAVVNSGKGRMPAFDSLATEEIEAVSNYVRTFTLPALLEQAPSDSTVENNDASIPLSEGEASDASTGTVYVNVISGRGGEVQAGLEITLHALTEVAEVFTSTLVTDQNGLVIFEDVSRDAGLFYGATIEFEEVTYASNLTGFVEESELNLTIEVFESTSETTDLVVDRLHIFFDFIEPDTIQVVELYISSNTGEKTIIPDDNTPVVRYGLPAEASNLQFQDSVLGQRYMPTDDGFGDLARVVPGLGAYQVMYAYDMPYDRKKAEIIHTLHTPATAVIVMAPSEGVKIKGDEIENAGDRDVDGVMYTTYNIPSIAAGDLLDIRVSGVPGESLLESVPGGALSVGIGAFGLAILITGVFLFLKNKGQSERESEEVSIDLQDTPENIMDSIIVLDDRYQAGEIPETVYIKRRDELKQKLQELVE